MEQSLLAHSSVALFHLSQQPNSQSTASTCSKHDMGSRSHLSHTARLRVSNLAFLLTCRSFACNAKTTKVLGQTRERGNSHSPLLTSMTGRSRSHGKKTTKVLLHTRTNGKSTLPWSRCRRFRSRADTPLARLCRSRSAPTASKVSFAIASTAARASAWTKRGEMSWRAVLRRTMVSKRDCRCGGKQAPLGSYSCLSGAIGLRSLHTALIILLIGAG